MAHASRRGADAGDDEIVRRLKTADDAGDFIVVTSGKRLAGGVKHRSRDRAGGCLSGSSRRSPIGGHPVAAVRRIARDGDVRGANGVSVDSWVYEGQAIQVPSAYQALVTATSSTASNTTAAEPAPVSAYGLTTTSGPLGSVQLDGTAASQWKLMRSAALSGYGIELYPAGTLSGYRTHEQQAYLYDLFLSGHEAPANPPGTSSDELGVAVDLPDPTMRDVIDQIGPIYGWYGIQSEWWHVEYWG